jgi:hypothetical protein
MELSKLPFTLKPQNTVSDLSIAAYFPFARVAPVDQKVVELATHVETVITLAPIEGEWPFCSVCGENGGRLHMYGTRRVRDLSLAHARVDLVVPNRKLRCANCRTIRKEGQSFLAPYRRHTLRFERAVADLCRHLPSSRSPSTSTSRGMWSRRSTNAGWSGKSAPRATTDSGSWRSTKSRSTRGTPT